MKPLSLKWRVSLLVTVVLAAVVVTISIVAHYEFQESHLRSIDRILLAMANGIAASLNDNSDTEELINEIQSVTGRQGWNPRTSYRIWMDGFSSNLFASDTPDSERGRWLNELSEQDGPKQDQRYNFIDIGSSGNEYRAIWMRQKNNDSTVNIVVASSSHFTYHEMHEFLKLLIILGVSLILGSVIAVMWTVRCGLLPIHRTAAQLRKITYQNIGKTNIDDLRTPEELLPFTEALKDMLGRLDRVLKQQRQFTSDAAHELRTPLALVKSTLQTMQLRKRDAVEYEHAIADVIKDIGRTEYLIEQMLLLARMDENNEYTSDTDVHLDELLRELTEIYNKKMESSGGKVILDEPPVTIIKGDIDALIRLFTNILDNAAIYGPTDGTIHITLKPKTDNYTTVYIHDEGGNIPPEALSYLFDRFYRVDKSRSSSTGGTGLGLAIAREIAHRHDGDIKITSNPESGTLVSIKLSQG